MDKIKIIGGNRLNGQIYISGAKNAALPLICASLLTDETVTLTNMPMLSDIRSMNALLEQMGTQIDSFDDFVDGHATKTYSYRTQKFSSLIAPYDYVRKMRASYYVLGPVLAREGHVELSLPGGCPSAPVRWTFTCHRWNRWEPQSKSKTAMFMPTSKGVSKGHTSLFTPLPSAQPAIS